MKIYFRYALFIMLPYFAISAVKAQERSSTAVVILREKLPLPKILRFGKSDVTVNSEDLQYLTDGGYDPLMSDTTKLIDTLRIENIQRTTVLRHKFNVVGFFEYLINPGDTLVVSQINGIPWAEVINRKLAPYDLNFELKFRRSAGLPDGFSAYDLLGYTAMGIDISGNGGNAKDRYLRATRTFELEKSFLDSVNRAHAVSPEIYNYYRSRVGLMALISKVQYGGIGSEEIYRILRDSAGGQSAMTASLYRELVLSASTKLFYKKEYLIKDKSGSSYDSRKIFNLIGRSAFSDPMQQKIMLRKELEIIAKRFSRNDYEQFSSIYVKRTGDELFADELRKKYLSGSLNVYGEKDFLFSDLKGTSIPFSQILTRYKGKVIFLDFWASWCIPCRETVPASKKLRQMMKAKAVSFVYLSIDSSVPKWHSASAEDGLPVEDSYILNSASRSGFLKKFKISTIPRYMILDKNGAISVANAPSPGSNLLKQLLDIAIVKDK
jgi:thiol-disulfide isomerase/thioredoxin